MCVLHLYYESMKVFFLLVSKVSKQAEATVKSVQKTSPWKHDFVLDITHAARRMYAHGKIHENN